MACEPHALGLSNAPQDCDPLWLTASDGTRFAFVGVQDIVSGKVAPADAFAPPDAAATGALMTPTILNGSPPIARHVAISQSHRSFFSPFSKNSACSCFESSIREWSRRRDVGYLEVSASVCACSPGQASDIPHSMLRLFRC